MPTSLFYGHACQVFLSLEKELMEEMISLTEETKQFPFLLQTVS